MQTSAVIGLGLIGGSFARAAKQAGRRVLGVDCCPQTREMALAAGAADDISDSIAAAGEAEEIFIAAPVGAFDDIFSALQKSLSPTATVFDGGSCKRRAMESAAAMLGDKAGRFVPCHPIAGGENSGFSASCADLFQGRKVVMCAEKADEDAAELAAAAWRRAGGRVARMSAEEHDAIFAAVSHLPHLLSFALVDSIRADSRGELMSDYAAGGFRDFTRIAGSDPVMWRDICLQNGDEILAALEKFQKQLAQLEKAAREGDGALLQKTFAAARDFRAAQLKKLED